MMNVGEISKPSVERTRSKKKLIVRPSDPVHEAHPVSDSVELSENSKKRYQSDEQANKERKPSPKQTLAEEEQQSKVATNINFEV
jgi:hypothetical protein